MKPKVAFYWCASCGGCEEAVLDLAEEILNVVDAVDIVFWPVALDFKEKDVEAMPDGAIAISLHQRRRAHQPNRWRWRGCCGANRSWWWPSARARNWAASPDWPTSTDAQRHPATKSTANGARPQRESRDNGHTLTLPKLFDTVFPLDAPFQWTTTCPAARRPPNIVADAFRTLLGEPLPEPGTVLAPDRAMCDECPRQRYPRARSEAGSLPSRAGPPARSRASASWRRACPAWVRPRAPAAARAASPATCPAPAASDPPAACAISAARRSLPSPPSSAAMSRGEIDRILDGIAGPGRHILSLQPSRLPSCERKQME